MRRKIHTALLAVLVGAAALVTAAPGIGAGGGEADGAPGIALSHAGPVLDAGALRPGQTVHGSIVVQNAGDAAARFRLSAAVTAPAALSRALVLRVSVGGQTAYDGPFAGFAAVGLGRLEPGEGVRVDFAALLPSGAPAALDGASLAAQFRWDATQL
jgi:hypothetical protein